jgi:hypothetical protein
MVVDNFDLLNAIVMPLEAEPPLAVNANGMLAGTIPAQRFQTVGGRDAKVRERFGKMQHCQFASGQELNILWQFF